MDFKDDTPLMKSSGAQSDASTDLDKKTVLRAVQNWVRDRQFHQARAIMEELRAKYPEDAEVLGEYAWILARGFREFDEAERLIQEAIRLEVYNARWYTIAARIYELKGDRRMTIQMLDRAFDWDPNYPPARIFQSKIGVRRAPVLSFLPRSHPLNRILGKIRHALFSRRR